MKFALGLCLGFVIASVMLALLNVASPRFTLPSCPEDSVLIGTGNFEQSIDGIYYWDHYVCGPAVDDFGG